MLRHETALVGLAGLFGLPYALTALASLLPSIELDTPWAFLLSIVLVASPYAYCVLRGLLAVDTLASRRPALAPVVGLACGIAALWFLPRLGSRPLVWLVAAGLLLCFDLRRLPPGFARKLLWSTIVLSLGLGLLCNLNYVFAPAVAGGLKDPVLARIDLAIYRWFLSEPTQYESLFPLVDSPVAFRLLESAYQMLFAELVLVVLATLWLARDVGVVLRAVMLCYLLAVVVFFFYPAVGPSIAYPETLRNELVGTETLVLIDRMATEFAAASRGLAINGFAYFVALPSLHVALAVLCQGLLHGTRPVLFWAVAPINVAIVASTVALGFHYIIDVPAGVLLALFSHHVVTRHRSASAILDAARQAMRRARLASEGSQLSPRSRWS